MYDPLKADDAITNGELECISQCVAEKWGKLCANRWPIVPMPEYANGCTWLTLDGDQAEENYTIALSSMSSCYVNFNGTRDDICPGNECLISFPGRGGLPTWCNYDTALIDGGKGGLEQSALPLVDDLVDTASDI